MMKLLFITQKIHGQDAFAILWIEAFMRRGYEVEVLCLERNTEDALRVLGRAEPFTFPVHSLGKEQGTSKARQVLRFWSFLFTHRFDRVFIHMTPVWGLFGAPVWILRRTPVYLWYTHYKMQAGLRALGHYAKRLFCATPQSLPQYEGNPKKVVVGHGIDLAFWKQRNNTCSDPHRLLMVHRLSRSKRVELSLCALTHLPRVYTLDIYGIEAEEGYVTEMRSLVHDLHLQERVTFHGTVPIKDLPDLFSSHRFILNMASETIDKTMLEAMTCSCYPVTTKRNAEAIGVKDAPMDDVPEAIAGFIEKHHDREPLPADALYRVVEERHSLDVLIEKMDGYMREGV